MPDSLERLSYKDSRDHVISAINHTDPDADAENPSDCDSEFAARRLSENRSRSEGEALLSQIF